MGSQNGRPSRIPPASEIATFLRGGGALAELAAAYRVSECAMQQRLNTAGYSSNGRPLAPAPRPGRVDLKPSAGGVAGHVAGQDNPTVVPTHAVVYSQPERPEGLDWDALRRQHVAAGGSLQVHGYVADSAQMSWGVNGQFHTYESDAKRSP